MQQLQQVEEIIALEYYGNGKFNITGTAQPGMFVKVESSASDAVVFLHDVNIDNSSTTQLPGVYIEPGAKVDMYLRGTNTLTGGGAYSGLGVPDGAELTLSSFNGDGSTEGTLTAQGGYDGGAGIGAPNYPATNGRAGTITINGGTINATGGRFGGTGIGGSDSEFISYAQRGGGTITINGGDITATGSAFIREGSLNVLYSVGAGIGSSTPAYDTQSITITGGRVRAYGNQVNSSSFGQYASAGIGGGAGSDSGTIIIRRGLVDAQETSTNFVYAEAGGSTAEAIGYGTNGIRTSVNTEADIEPPAMRQAPDLPTIITGYDETERIIGYHDEEITIESSHASSISEISQFYNTSGALIVDPYQTITITQGNGQSAEIILYPADTMHDVANKINDVIANTFGHTAHTDNSGKFCTISDGTENTSESVFKSEPLYDDNGNLIGHNIHATMLVRSAIPGKAGELYFSGDEELLNALGLNTIQESTESTFNASVYDAHSGARINEMKSEGSEFSSIIPPEIDIHVDPMTGLIANWDEQTKKFIFAGNDSYSAVLHLKDNGVTFQTGANKGEDFMIQLADTSCNAIGISGVNVLTRETASRSISIIDRAINKISSQRAKIGSYENALEHTMTNLTTASMNLTSAESRIRDADMSKLMMNFVKLQIMNQSGTSMLAQANQLPQSVLSLLS